jgi:hypothetical protein
MSDEMTALRKFCECPAIEEITIGISLLFFSGNEKLIDAVIHGHML